MRETNEGRRAVDKVKRAQTEALFRDVNERIAENADRFDADEAEFVCECADPNCTHRVKATLDEYEDVREEATHFLLVPGHEEEDIERVVERRPGHAVVEKFERIVARTVTKLDPRADTV
jgi:transcription initiation factor TFIID subunit TAF12